jgi:hypothetical protein
MAQSFLTVSFVSFFQGAPTRVRKVAGKHACERSQAEQRQELQSGSDRPEGISVGLIHCHGFAFDVKRVWLAKRVNS